MKNRNRERYLRIAVLLTVFIVPATVFGQDADKAARVAAFKQAVQKSIAGLRKYEWIETTTVSFKGEVKSQKQNRCYYGADGRIQKVPIAEAAPPQEQSRRGGPLRNKIIEKKKEEMTDYMKQAVALVHQYVPPDPALIQYSKDVKKVSVEPLEPNRTLRVSFRDFIKMGDLFSGTLNVVSNAVIDLNISTWVESNTDVVTVAVLFIQLPDGTSYSSRSVLEAKSKNIRVVVENSGHRPH